MTCILAGATGYHGKVLYSIECLPVPEPEVATRLRKAVVPGAADVPETKYVAGNAARMLTFSTPSYMA